MKRILGIAVVLGLVGALTVMAQEVKPGKVDVVDFGEGVKLEMVLIPAGKFKMGSKKNPVDPFSNIKVEQPPEGECPQHEVTLTKPFYMGKYEVTQDQWFKIMGENRSKEKGRKLPVTNVSWESCQDFIKILNAKTNGGYRLPTEAEWEYACRAGTTTAYSFGDTINPKDANYKGSLNDNEGQGREGFNPNKPVAVGSYRPNAFGLYDMHGNVWEWCNDFGANYSSGSVIDPGGPEEGYRRVYRGGSFNYPERVARSSQRSGARQTAGRTDMDNTADVGFRLARTPDIKAGASLTAPKSDPIVITPATKSFLVTPFTEAKAKEAQKEVAKSLQKEVEEKADLGKGVNLEMVLIPAGKFKMGSPASEKGRRDNEKQYEVTITKPFYIGKYEVTQEEWQAVMGNNPSEMKGVILPVTRVSWDDCQEFIKKLNANTNGGYRLPTEAEWEYACRAGTTTAYSFGDKITPKDANYWESKINKSVIVGSYKPNAFGLYDMHGNLFEWCEDWHGEYPFTVTDLKGPAKGEYRVLRGGSFFTVASNARCSYRLDGSPSVRDSGLGFRLAKTP